MNREALAENIVAQARQWLGTPYIHQASVCGQGCDCLGLVRGVWRAIYGMEPARMPAYSHDWGEVSGDENLLCLARLHMAEIAQSQAAAGDLLVFRWQSGFVAKHMGILTGTSRFVHSWERAGVVEVSLVPMWRKRIAAVFRFPLPLGERT